MAAAVIPIKALSSVKQRLSPAYSPSEREALCLYMLENLLNAVSGCQEIRHSFVVTSDETVGEWLSKRFPQATIIRDEPEGGLNRACALSARHVTDSGEESMLFLHGDLPAATSSDIRALIELSKRYEVVIVPDKHGRGTNALALTPPDRIVPSFGTDSFARHKSTCEEKGLSYCVYRNEGLSMDIDSKEDAEWLRCSGIRDQKLYFLNKNNTNFKECVRWNGPKQ